MGNKFVQLTGKLAWAIRTDLVYGEPTPPNGSNNVCWSCRKIEKEISLFGR